MEVSVAHRRQVAIDYWPHPITSEGRHSVVVEDGETLEEIFGHEIFAHDPAVAYINGKSFARRVWPAVQVFDGDVVKVRRVAQGGDGSNPIAAVLSIALLIAAPFAAGFLAPSLAAGLGATGAVGLAGVAAGLTALIGTAGLIVVNALFPPRLPNVGGAQAQIPRHYTLSGGANRSRPFEPLLWVLGTHRVWPDSVAQEYTEYDDEGDQYLNQIFDYGIGSIRVTDQRIGQTPIGDYADVQTQAGVRRVTLVKGNVDTLGGGDLGYVADETNTVSRTTAANTTRIAIDLAGLHFTVGDEGAIEGKALNVEVSYVPTGGGARVTDTVTLTSPSGPEARQPVRRSFYYDVASGEYDVRVRPVAADIYAADADLDRTTVRLELGQIRAFQNETADFLGRNPLAVRIKATGQLYGRLQTVSGIVKGTESNPADVLLAYLKGVFIDNALVAGMGLPTARIDTTSISAWKTFCTDNDLTCNMVLEDGRDHSAIMEVITQCGWGSIDRQSGKWGVLWEDAGRAMSALITPDSVIAGTMSVAYEHDGLADEVSGTFLDASNDYQPTTIRRTMPNVTMPVRPVAVEMEGITNGDQAAMELNRTVAQQFYHTRVVAWEMLLDEGMGIARGDVVGASHGLIGAGSGGRFVSISADRTSIELSVDPEIDDTPIESGNVWVWTLDGAVRSRAFTRTSARNIRLSAALPALTGTNEDDPSSYRFMAFSGTAKLEKLRITGKEPHGDRIRFTARDEVSAYYDHRTADLDWIPVDARESASRKVTGFSVTESNLGVRIFTWSRFDGETLGYQIRFGADGATFAGMQDLHEGLLGSSPFEVVDRPASGTYRFGIVAVRPDGTTTDPSYDTATLGEIIEGLDGTDGQGVEYVFLATDLLTLPAGLRPDDDWGFDSPGSRTATVDGTSTTVTWRDGADSAFSASNNLMYRCQRRVPGTPAQGADVAAAWTRTWSASGRSGSPPSSDWSDPVIVARWGRDGEQGPPGTDGTDGQDGQPGAAGADGAEGIGVEYVFAVTPANVTEIPLALQPDNGWGYDSPGLRN